MVRVLNFRLDLSHDTLFAEAGGMQTTALLAVQRDPGYITTVTLTAPNAPSV